jgi:hypothetical protein
MKLLTTEEKKILRTFSRYLMSFGKENAVIDFDSNGEAELDLSDEIPFQQEFFSNYYNIPIPDFIYPIIDKILNYSKDSLEIEQEWVNYLRFEIEIDVETQKISGTKYWSYLDDGSSSGDSWEAESDKGEVEKIFSTLKSENLVGQLRLDYTGGGDSGYIESQFTSGAEVPAEIEDWCYQKLENLHGGWEINEGSHGYFTFNIETRVIELEHTYNEDVHRQDTIFEESFAK